MFKLSFSTQAEWAALAVRVVVRCMGKRASKTGSATAVAMEGLLRVLGYLKGW
jgi:hypothetical protein